MPQDAADDRPGGDGGDEAQGAVVTPGTSFPVEGKHALEQPRPPPARRGRAGCLLEALLAAGWGEG